MSQEWSAMGHQEKSLLWQQRLFEAEAGLTRHLVENRQGRCLTDWIRTRAEIFSDLPQAPSDPARTSPDPDDPDPDDPDRDASDRDAPQEDDPAAWQRVFFRAQALMERFLVSRYGHGELKAWADSVAEVHRHVEPRRGAGALGPVLRLGRQAELYGSRFRLRETGPQRSSLDIEHCGIWDYRERARRRGVPITLASPCEYCTHATTANVAAKGYTARYELTDGADGPGCRWEVSAPAHPAPAPLDPPAPVDPQAAVEAQPAADPDASEPALTPEGAGSCAA